VGGARGPLRQLAALATPAVRLARDGVARPPGLERATRWFRGLLERDAEAARIFLADGPLVQPELARTLADLEGFYSGPVAARTPAPFTPADFAAHRVRWVEPLRRPFAGTVVCEMPAPSRGGLVLDAIGRLAPLDGLGPDDAEWHHRLIRALRAATLGGDTIYLCVVDGQGMAVSLNQSLFMGFGSGVVVPGTGVLLHDRGAYHSRATYRGGAVPVHTLSPAMALAGGRPRLVFGTMGGEAQVQVHLQLLARILIAGEPIGAAVAAPRWRFDGATLMVEAGLPALTAGALGGLAIAPMPVADLAGHAHAIQIGGDGLEAGCDPRADGVPVGD
jgi:gamma-glutamyltranspeptidase/glutathione hydrolase